MDKTARNKSRLLCSCVEPVKRLIVWANELIKKLSYPLLTIKQRLKSNTQKKQNPFVQDCTWPMPRYCFKRPKGKFKSTW